DDRIVGDDELSLLDVDPAALRNAGPRHLSYPPERCVETTECSHMPKHREIALAERSCKGCEGGAKKLAKDEIAALLWQIDGWKCVKSHHVEKSFAFDDFAQPLAFANRIGRVAERQGHHPDLFVKWGLLRVTIYTHSVDGLTEDDFILAAKID